MPNLGADLRELIDGGADPVSIAEVTTTAAQGSGEPDQVSGHHRRWVLPAAGLAVAAAIIVTLVLVGHDRAGRHTDVHVNATTPVSPPSTASPVAGFGAEVAPPPVPAGWKVLDAGDLRVAVPADWSVPSSERCMVAGAPGAVIVEAFDRVGCSLPTPLPDAVLRIEAPTGKVDSGESVRLGTFEATRLSSSGGSCTGCAQRYLLPTGEVVSASGPDAERILQTLTDSGPTRVLQSGPAADASGWKPVSYQGVSFLAPPSWQIDDLPASYQETRTSNGDVEVRSDGDPGVCGGSMFPPGSARLSLGEARYGPSCAAFIQYQLEPGDGAWIRPAATSGGALGEVIGHGRVGGLDVDVVEVAADQRWTPSPSLELVLADGRSSWRFSLGVGLDTSVARAVLGSLHATSAAATSTTSAGDDTPIAPVATTTAGRTTASLTRPVLDLPDCQASWAREGAPSRVDSVFARRSSLPIALQAFADPVDPYGHPFAIVQRIFADQRSSTPSPAPGATVFNHRSGRSSANWILPDGSEIYLNTRGLTDDEVVALAKALVPRPLDAPVPGVDLPTTASNLRLVDELLGPIDVPAGPTSACLAASGQEMIVSIVGGRPLARFPFLIDRPAPYPAVRQLDDGRTLLVAGVIAGDGTDAVRALSSVRQASEQEWSALLASPTLPDQTTPTSTG